MNFSAFQHVSDSRFLLPISDQEVEVKLKTGKEIKEVEIFYGDPFYGEKDHANNWVWVKESIKMFYYGEGEFFKYFYSKIKIKNKRLRYYFKLIDNKGKIAYFGEKGIYQDISVHNDNFFGFSFPYYHLIDAYNPPNWLSKTIWYQIFPERFANGDMQNDPVNTLPWNACLPKYDSFYGGDLRGIINNLDYLNSLGINGIYLTPIFESPSNHKYDTVDYFKIDPSFGTKEDLKELVTLAHQKGIKIVLDAVFNHSSILFPPFQDVLNHQENSRYKDWFYLKTFPVKIKRSYNVHHDYETFAFAYNMPKLNTENPEVEAYLIKAAVYWIKECDVDGYRIDVANEQPHRFWRKFKQEIKKVKNDAVLIGESWSYSQSYLDGDQFDSVMNYLLTNLITDYVARNKISSKTFVKRITDLYNLYQPSIQKNQFNLLDSHDTVRIYNQCLGDFDKIKACYTLLFTHPGTPCVYYGSENGMQGEHDPDCRRCMMWDEKEWNLNIRNYIIDLIQLRNHYQEYFINGNYFISQSHDTLIICNKLEKYEIITYIYKKEPRVYAKIDKVLLKNGNILIGINSKKEEML